jgi:hypothetical protein
MAAYLPRCIASIRPYADRIIVVEGLFAAHWRSGDAYSALHSSDGTVAVAEALGCEVLVSDGLPQHRQRDLYLIGKEGDVYFSIDADMTLEGVLDKQELLYGDGCVWSVWVHDPDDNRQISPIWVSRHIGAQPHHTMGNLRVDGYGRLMDGTYPNHRILTECYLKHYNLRGRLS